MSVGFPCLSSDNSTTTIPLEDNLKVIISTSSSLKLETGGSVWHAAMALTHHILTNEHIVKDKVVLEIGAGCALPGITAGLKGAKAVILTDIPEQVQHLQQNVDWNAKQCPSCEFICVPFMFGDNISDLKNQLVQHQLQQNTTLSLDVENISIDVVLGCDLAYDVCLHDPLVQSVRSLLLPSSVALLMEEGIYLKS